MVGPAPPALHNIVRFNIEISVATCLTIGVIDVNYAAEITKLSVLGSDSKYRIKKSPNIVIPWNHL